MNQTLPITKEFFVKRVADLCLRSGLTGFPKEDIDQQILLKSMALVIGRGGTLSEKQINEKLQYWMLSISKIKKLDHSSLRRWLVDAGYLIRTKDGSSYQVVEHGPHDDWFAADVETIDLAEEMRLKRDEFERRKQEYLQKSAQEKKNV